MKFGTLSDYFRAIWQRRGVKPGEKPPGFPVLGGDFFTYADRYASILSSTYDSDVLATGLLHIKAPAKNSRICKYLES